ncbi:DUF2771 family protein [Tsukamurella ocularis]|uniref:DUF2771 family protein n=1 Tax=Tsukamurella ocularis TaxID=1970234 RepID=UPI0039EF850A
MIKPSPKLLLAGAVFAIAAAVLFAFTVVAGLDKRDEPEPRPTLQATVGKTMLNVAPNNFCTNVRAQECDQPRKPARLSVEPGQAIVISLPDYITSRPWFLTVQRLDTRTRTAWLDHVTHTEPAGATLVLKSTDDVLVTAVEISVPSDVLDASGDIPSQAVWGIDTLAESVAKDYALVQKP